MASIDKDEVIQSLALIASQLKARYKVRSLYIFGSIARGEGTADSDIDILVDFEKGADLFDLMAVGNILEERLGRKVDVVSRGGLRKELRDIIEKEAVAV